MGNTTAAAGDPELTTDHRFWCLSIIRLLKLPANTLVVSNGVTVPPKRLEAGNFCTVLTPPVPAVVQTLLDRSTATPIAFGR